MSNIVNFRALVRAAPPKHVIDLADSLVNAERDALTMTASMGRLLAATAEAGLESAHSVPNTLPVYTDLQGATAASFAHLERLSAVHDQFLAMAKNAVEKGTWIGPDEPCFVKGLAKLAERTAA